MYKTISDKLDILLTSCSSFNNFSYWKLRWGYGFKQHNLKLIDFSSNLKYNSQKNKFLKFSKFEFVIKLCNFLQPWTCIYNETKFTNDPPVRNPFRENNESTKFRICYKLPSIHHNNGICLLLLSAHSTITSWYCTWCFIDFPHNLFLFFTVKWLIR